MSTIYSQIVERIIKQQENIIGPLAVDQAKKVSGIELDEKSHEVQLEGDGKSIVEQLVKQYEDLFGKISIEVCKEAVKSLNVPKDELPIILQ